MLCRQAFGAVLGDVIGVGHWRRLRGRLRSAAIVELMMVVVVGGGRFHVDGGGRGLPVEVQVPQRRRPYVMVGRRWRLFLVVRRRGSGFLFHHVTAAGKRAAEIAEPAKDSAVDVAVDVLDHRYLVDLDGGKKKLKIN